MFSLDDDDPWIGLSELHTWGTYRWTTGASLSWADWNGAPAKLNEKPCVYISEGEFKLSQCDDTRRYLCQTRPRYGT